MDSLNFLKFWRSATMTTTTVPDLVVETDSDSEEEEEEEDSFFDLELTLHDPLNKTTPCFNTEKASLSSNEPISKRRILPVEPTSKPQSPIALLRSAPSFRLFTFKKRMAPVKTQEAGSESKAFKVKLSIGESSPTLSRVNSTRSFESRVQNHGSERVSKDVVQKYLKLIKPLYWRISKRYSEKIEASPSSSPLVDSVSSKKEKLGSFPAGMRGVSKHLGKSRSASTVVGVGSPAKWSDDTLMQQNDGIQSAILHCKKSFNSSRDSTDSVRSSFEDEDGTNM